jgi:hypothetical protein
VKKTKPPVGLQHLVQEYNIWYQRICADSGNTAPLPLLRWRPFEEALGLVSAANSAFANVDEDGDDEATSGSVPAVQSDAMWIYNDATWPNRQAQIYNDGCC